MVLGFRVKGFCMVSWLIRVFRAWFMYGSGVWELKVLGCLVEKGTRLAYYSAQSADGLGNPQRFFDGFRVVEWDWRGT